MRDFPRVSCAELGQGPRSEPYRVQGRALIVDQTAARVTLADPSGTTTLSVAPPLPQAGDIIELTVERPSSARSRCAVLTPYRRGVPFPSPGGDSYRLLREESGSTRLARLRQRAAALAGLRAFFDQRGYLEVETPRRVRHPGLEPQLAAERAGWGYLITSPEYQLKRLLAGGLERIYSLGSCWRGEERGPLHLNEFCLLEWYQAHSDLNVLMDETEQLVQQLASGINGHTQLTRGTLRVDLSEPFHRLSVAEAFLRFAGLDISGAVTSAELASRATRAGLAPIDPASDYDEVFSRLLVEHVEPELAQLGAVFLHHYPAPLAALARRAAEDPSVAERAELYICGVELSNGFAELTDPAEQLARLEQDQQLRRRRGLPVHDIDRRFIEALREGIPPSAGNALGVDRLLMLLTGANSVAEVVAFAPEEL